MTEKIGKADFYSRYFLQLADNIQLARQIYDNFSRVRQ